MASVVLYDIASKTSRTCWSPNTWKTRLVLNFKNIPYNTEWLSYPDITPTLRERDVALANAETSYTCPAILLPSSDAKMTLIMNSAKIAEVIERMYPTPSLHLDSPILPEVEALAEQIRKLFAPIVIPLMKRHVWTTDDTVYKEKTLIPFLGMSIEDLERIKGGEKAWASLQEPLKQMADLLKRHGGPFILGDTVSYADFIIAGILQTGKRIGDGGIYHRMTTVDSVYEELFTATEKWAIRDDH